jgi:hypothetical protein
VLAAQLGERINDDREQHEQDERAGAGARPHEEERADHASTLHSITPAGGDEASEQPLADERQEGQDDAEQHDQPAGEPDERDMWQAGQEVAEAPQRAGQHGDEREQEERRATHPLLASAAAQRPQILEPAECLADHAAFPRRHAHHARPTRKLSDRRRSWRPFVGGQ